MRLTRFVCLPAAFLVLTLCVSIVACRSTTFDAMKSGVVFNAMEGLASVLRRTLNVEIATALRLSNAILSCWSLGTLASEVSTIPSGLSTN